jgi:thiol-disulfide isomerase/thioredoxin
MKVVRGAIALVSVVGATAISAQESGIPVGTKAPGGVIEALDGTPTDLGAIVAKGPTVIEFWATWCENCKTLEPTLLAAQRKYAGKVQFVGVSVSVNQSPELVKRYVAKHKLAGTQLYDRKGVTIDAYDVPATSFVVVINKAGKVVYTGLGGKQDLDEAIKKAM